MSKKLIYPYKEYVVEGITDYEEVYKSLKNTKINRIAFQFIDRAVRKGMDFRRLLVYNGYYVKEIYDALCDGIDINYYLTDVPDCNIENTIKIIRIIGYCDKIDYISSDAVNKHKLFNIRWYLQNHGYDNLIRAVIEDGYDCDIIDTSGAIYTELNEYCNHHIMDEALDMIFDKYTYGYTRDSRCAYALKIINRFVCNNYDAGKGMMKDDVEFALHHIDLNKDFNINNYLYIRYILEYKNEDINPNILYCGCDLEQITPEQFEFLNNTITNKSEVKYYTYAFKHMEEDDIKPFIKYAMNKDFFLLYEARENYYIQKYNKLRSFR